MKKIICEIKDLQKIEIICVYGGGQCRCYGTNKETGLWNGINKLQSCIKICCNNHSYDWSYKFIYNKDVIHTGVCPKKINNNLQQTSKIHVINSQTIFDLEVILKTFCDF